MDGGAIITQRTKSVVFKGIYNLPNQPSIYLHSDGAKSVTLPSWDLSCHAGTAVEGGTLLGMKLLKFNRTKCDVQYNPVVRYSKQIRH